MQHFVAPPEWGWYIVWYFFLGGIAGGAYVLGTLLRLRGSPQDAPMADLAFRLAFPLVLVCPVLLILDLGRPGRFWHMVLDRSGGGLVFKSWSPMSVGVYVLLGFGLFSLISFVATLQGPSARRLGQLMAGAFGRAVMVLGSVFGLLLAGYTGVLLSVSNQPVWSDTWALGGLFLASGLSAAAAALMLLAARRAGAVSGSKLARADGWFLVLELALLVLFLLSLGGVAGRLFAGRWLLLWLLVLAGSLVPLAMRFKAAAGREGLASVLVLIGGLSLRTVVVFAAQG